MAFATAGGPVRNRLREVAPGALAWVAASTPADAVVVTEPVSFDTPPATAGSGRREFVLGGGHHTEGPPPTGHDALW